MPDVSVIVPVHNRARLLAYTLSSLRAERHPGIDLEVVVIDDGSTEAIEAPGTRLIRQEHAGAPAARNRGLKLAHAPLVLFLDSDDLVEPGFFAPRLVALETSGADGAYGPWDCFAGDAEFSESLIVPRHAGYPIELSRADHLTRLCGGWYIHPASMVWRRSIIERIGGYDTNLAVNQDVDLMFRALMSSSVGVAGAGGPRGLVREHDGHRQGAIGDSPTKVRAILDLRRLWATQLDGAQRDALARFCFDRWREYRRTFPVEAHEFLLLSRTLGKVKVKGRWPLRMAGRLLGPALATRLRDLLA